MVGTVGNWAVLAVTSTVFGGIIGSFTVNAPIISDEYEELIEYYRRAKHDRLEISGFEIYAEHGVFELSGWPLFSTPTPREMLEMELAALSRIVDTWGRRQQEMARNTKIIVNKKSPGREEHRGILANAYWQPIDRFHAQYEEPIRWTRGAIVIPMAASYAFGSNTLLHEMGHSVHLRQSEGVSETCSSASPPFWTQIQKKFDVDCLIRVAYEHAKAAELYAWARNDAGAPVGILYGKNAVIGVPYGLTNHKEYFAESVVKFYSEVGHSDYPVTNAELKAFDRQAWDMVKAVTGVSDEDAAVFEGNAPFGYVSKLGLRFWWRSTPGSFGRPYWALCINLVLCLSCAIIILAMALKILAIGMLLTFSTA